MMSFEELYNNHRGWWKLAVIVIFLMGLACDVITWYVAITAGWKVFCVVAGNRLLMGWLIDEQYPYWTDDLAWCFEELIS